MNWRRAAGLAAVTVPSALAHGAIFFTFQDPGPNRELSVQEHADHSMTLSYSMSETVSLAVTSDAGEVADTVFDQTRLTLAVTTSVTPIVDEPGLLVTRVSGTFVFDDMSGVGPVTILSGTFDRAVTTLLMSQFMGTIEASGSAAGDSTVDSLTLTAGTALESLLANGAMLGGRQTASFALSELTGGLDEQGLMSLVGSAAFTGSSEVIPAPGVATVFGLSAVGVLRRRRR